MSELFSSSEKTIAIVGGGFAGCALAIQLLRRASAPLRILLIERKPPFGGGVAYGTKSPDHLLNVRADQMGCLPEAPDDFVCWLREHREEEGVPETFEPTDFLPRRLYGAYVASRLGEAEAEAPDGVE